MTSFRCGSFCVALLSLGSGHLFNAKADTISTWNGGSGNWSAAGQWTPSRVPNNTGSQFYDVTIGSGSATLDISPTINSFTLNGNLAEGFDFSGRTTLTVDRNATVNGSIIGKSFFVGWRDSLAVGGNLTNNGSMQMQNGVSVGGNMNNSGSLILIGGGGVGPGSGFTVGGTLLNTGGLTLGSPDGVDEGPPTSLGALVNKGSIFITSGTSVTVKNPSAIIDIPKGASWLIAGPFNGFAGLTRIKGSLDIEGTLNGDVIVSPLTLGSPGSTIHNSTPLTIGSSYGTSVVNVAGNLSNTGDIEVAAPGMTHLPQLGPSTLNVAGTLTNQATGNLSVNVPSNIYSPSPGALNVGTLINYGTATFNAGTASTANFFENGGRVNIFGDEAGDVGSLTVSTLKTAGGHITVWELGGLLTVGSGAAPAGFTGYDQLANGVLDAAGGELEIHAPIDLNGTLDIMLGDGYKPIGTVFTVLWAGNKLLTGAFSNVEGLTFDDGREKYLLTYFGDDGSGVYLTVENNTTPEPGSVFLMSLGFAGILVGAARKQLPGHSKVRVESPPV